MKKVTLGQALNECDNLCECDGYQISKGDLWVYPRVYHIRLAIQQAQKRESVYLSYISELKAELAAERRVKCCQTPA